MIARRPAPIFARPHLLSMATAALAIGIFTADTTTSAGVAFAVLYVAVVRLSDRFSDKLGVLKVTLVCVAITITILFLSPGDPFGPMRLGNAVLSVTAIGATAYLVLQNRRPRDEQAQPSRNSHASCVRPHWAS